MYKRQGRYWADAFVDRYQKIPEDSDIILVMGGTNDEFCASLVEFGNSAERKRRTFWGDLDELMDGLKTDYPNAEVIFMTPLPNSLQDYLKIQHPYLIPQDLSLIHISEPTRLGMISYAVFCLKKKKKYR